MFLKRTKIQKVFKDKKIVCTAKNKIKANHKQSQQIANRENYLDKSALYPKG